ncbi:Mu transposase C-terminal domain-containing protein [Neobacillus sp. YIM B06451]|uniref:Mu transposase C-terminal domain-containing protein n=1 Tax=Neobacillus sp. YIM B06451 TaxID=3070994 RepID=UPI0029306162|nr:Mu transposase C-terminal domain-containing protein [Neobacillus sp. YIM B06451]
MGKVHVSRGTRFILNNRPFEIKEEIKKDVFIVKDLEFANVEQQFTLFELLHHLDAGNLQFNVQGRQPDENGSGLSYQIDDFSMFQQKQQDEAKFRFMVIEPLLGIEVNSLNPYVLGRIEELGRKGIKVSRASIYRWLKSYIESEGEISSLVSKSYGPKKKMLSKEVEIIIDRIIDGFYKRREKITVITIYELVYHEIDKENINRNFEDRLEHPSESTIRRRILERDAYDLDKGRKGSRAAWLKHRQALIQEKPKYPLQRVEVDHTTLDIMLLDDNTLEPLKRPTITSLIDVCTGYPLGIYIGFEPPSYTSVMHALLHAISPKTYVKTKYPSVENEWLAYGLPELLVVDNGKEFRSKHLKEACFQLGIELYHCPVRMPWYKGAIERHFRTLNQQLVHQTPGTTFSNVLEKGDYNPKKKAAITFNGFLEIFHIWLIDYYAHKVNRGVNGVPARIWKTAFEHLPSPAIPSSKLDWKIALMKLNFGSIQHTGIRKGNLFYRHDSLGRLKSKLKAKGKANKVKYKYDPNDISRIYVFDEFEGKYYEALCTDQTYTEGLNEYAHKLILKNNRKENLKVDPSSLARAKAKMMAKYDDERNLTAKQVLELKRAEGKGTNRELTLDDPKPSLRDVKLPSVATEPTVDMDEIDLDDDWGYFDAKN